MRTATFLAKSTGCGSSDETVAHPASPRQHPQRAAYRAWLGRTPCLPGAPWRVRARGRQLPVWRLHHLACRRLGVARPERGGDNLHRPRPADRHQGRAVGCQRGAAAQAAVARDPGTARRPIHKARRAGGKSRRLQDPRRAHQAASPAGGAPRGRSRPRHQAVRQHGQGRFRALGTLLGGTQLQLRRAPRPGRLERGEPRSEG